VKSGATLTLDDFMARQSPMEQYSHLLIPTSHEYCANPTQVAKFMQDAVALGVVGDNPEIMASTLKRVAPQVRISRSPFTGQAIELHLPTRMPNRRLALRTLADLPQELTATDEYDVSISGFTLPKLPPLAIDFQEPYHIRIACHVRAQLVCMSSGRAEAHFGHDCTEAESLGVFLHPETAEVIEVQDAGRARFWIEFELGKWLRPDIVGGNLELLHLQLVDLARKCFQTHFVQGCIWG
jgi:hypothetical protein